MPDAEPRIEPVRPGGPNKPYAVQGQAYAPVLGDPAVVERGLASWYGRKFHGRSTASGETYNMYAMTAAHRTMPIPSYARVRNPANGREVLVRINDRGPFHAERIVDLSYTAALKLGVLGGVAPVELERITYEAIRTGSWRRPGGDTALAAAPQPIEGGAADAIGDIARRAAAEPVADAGTAGAGPSPPASGSPAPTAAGRGFWLQLGAFRQRAAAIDLQQQLQRQADWLAPLLAVFNERSLHRLQAGPYASRDDAGAAAERLRDLLPALPLIVERR
ncbi:septal ring lytic transglycosylase RlpA family protein [Aquabacterium sp.]|uniref:septal ring lytic transglycosylase RlpA family protein n=1 Tax=Aquabacterium sp. TaxID=1872578 RepID=UPI002B90F4AA|nr:septal ring lytic transglycosylase RlpA family protein [Aquabacterium sp.]HSW07069.1 septal ring lytic transglycosylase RlpA family protein [Aquabacterium sp.]